MINFYSYWLGNEEQKKKIEKYFSKIEKLNKNIKFHLGPTKEEHEYLLEKFKFYSMNFKRQNFSFCSDIWRLYKMLVLGNDDDQNKNIYIDSKTLFNEERLNELVSLIENNNNILIKEKSHRIWSGFIYLSNKNKNILYDSLNFYYFFPQLTNSSIFIAPGIMSIFLWKSKKENIKNIFFFDARDIDPLNDNSILKYNGFASWRAPNRKKDLADTKNGANFFHNQAIKFEENKWTKIGTWWKKWYWDKFCIIFFPYIWIKWKTRKKLEIENIYFLDKKEK